MFKILARQPLVTGSKITYHELPLTKATGTKSSRLRPVSKREMGHIRIFIF